MKISKLSTAKINTLIGELHNELNKRSSTDKVKLEVEQFLKKHGITIGELFGINVKSRKVAPKWRHKEDKSLTWAGRGRQPKWIKKYGVKI